MQFRFDGRRIPCQPGDTLASALHRDGVRVLGRSLKYHRPRGLFCNTGSCASCLVEVDGEPNVLACLRPAEGAAEVRSQNRIGTARRDLLGAVDKVYRQGFDPHDAFTRFRVVNEAFLKGVRFMSGLGRPPAPDVTPRRPARRQHRVGTLVVGGGRQGLEAALDAVRGTDGRPSERASPGVLIIDDGPVLGGDAAWDPDQTDTHRLVEAVQGKATVLQGTCFGIYGSVAAAMVDTPTGLELHEIEAERIVIATGSYDAWPLFPNNDLPGILSLRGAQRLLGQGVLPGRSLVVHQGALPAGFTRRLAEAGARIVAHGEVEEVRGDVQVERVLVDGAWHVADTVVSVLPRHPRIELLQQAGYPLVFGGGALRPAVEGTLLTDAEQGRTVDLAGRVVAGEGSNGPARHVVPRIEARFTESMEAEAAGTFGSDATPGMRSGASGPQDVRKVAP